MFSKSEIGKKGEWLAREYLVNLGYKIIGENVRVFKDEIDIVAKNKDGLLIFVEVKTMIGSLGGLVPEDNLSSAKLRKIRRSALMFAGKHQNLFEDKPGWRIDLIAVTLFSAKHAINHYENIG